MQKTYQPKQKEIKRNWHLLNADGETLGRLSTKIATFLMGKHKVNYSRHMDSGDFVVVTNAEKVVLTGKKDEQKVYRSHSGYPGGFREVSVAKMRKEHPTRIIQKSVFGMLQDNRLRDKRMARLKILVGEKNSFANRFSEHEMEDTKKE